MWFVILCWAWTVSLAVGVYTGLILSWFQNYQVALTHWGRDKTVSTLQPTFSIHFLEWKWMNFEFQWGLFLKGRINNIPALFQTTAWRQPGDKPLSEPMMFRLPTHIGVTRSLWVDKNTTKLQVYYRHGLRSYWDVCPEIFSLVSWYAYYARLSVQVYASSTFSSGAECPSPLNKRHVGNCFDIIQLNQLQNNAWNPSWCEKSVYILFIFDDNCKFALP